MCKKISLLAKKMIAKILATMAALLSIVWYTFLSFVPALDNFLYGVAAVPASNEQSLADEPKGPWSHRFVETNNVQLHVAESGVGNDKLMLCVHGFPEFWYSWRHQLREFASSYHVVAVDMRGYNLSEKPARRTDYDKKELVNDVAGLVVALGYERASVLVAHDWGGAVAWQAVAEHPELFERLAVLNCPHPANMMRALRSNDAQQRRSWYMFAFQLPFAAEAWVRANVHRLFANSMRNPENFDRDDEAAFLRAANQPGAMRAAVNYYRNIFTSLRPAPTPKISVPTLLVWGQDDEALGQELTIGTERNFVDPELFSLKLVPRCSHWTQQDQPELVNIILNKFLAD
jgi:epoxide hydrolase 4